MADSLTSVIISAQDRTQAAFSAVAGGLGKLQSGFSSLNAVAGSLGAALGVGVIAAWAKETIAAASALDDLADSTGSTVERLSALQNSMAVSGVDAGTFASLINKLAVGLSGVDDEGGKAAKALAALGVQSKDPAAAMKELAEKLDQYADGANKAALLTAIFGRGAAQYAGALRDLAHDTEMAATVTTDFAAEAEKLQKEMARSKVSIEGAAAAIASSLLPEVNNLLEQFTKGIKIAGGFWNALLVFGTINPFRDLNTNIAETKKDLEALKAGLANPASWVPSFLRVSQSEVDSKQRQYDFLKFQEAQGLAGKYGGDGWNAFDPSIAKPDAPKPPAADHVAKVKKAADTWHEFAAAIKRAHDNALAWEEAGQEIAKQQETIATAIADGNTAMAVYVDQQYDAVKAYEEQTAAIGKTTDELNALELARQAEIRDMRLMAGWGQDAIDIYNGWAAAIGRRNAALADQSAIKAAEETSRATQRMVDDFADQAGDFLDDFAHNGSKAFKNLWNDFVSWGLKALAQIAARQLVISLGGVAAGGSSSAFGSALGGSGGIGGSLGSLGQSYLGQYATGAVTGIANAYASGAAGYALNASLTGTAMTAGGEVVAGLGAAMAAVPVAGWVALAAAIVYGIVEGMEEGPAERLADFVSGAAAKGGNQKFASSSKFGDFGFVNDKWFSDDPGFVKAIESINTAVRSLDNSIAGMVGDDMAQTIADALATHTQSVSMGSEDANLDQVAALSGAQILMDRYSVVLDTINGSLDDLLKGFSGTGAELAVFVSDIVAVNQALQNADVAEMFGDATVAAFDALRNEGETLGAAFQRLAGEFQLTTLAADLLGGSFGAAGLESAAAREQFIQFAGGAAALAQNLQTYEQAFFSDEERLARTQDAVTEAMSALNLSLPTTRDGFRDLVDGLDLSTEAGRQAKASLLGIAAGVDAIYDAAERHKANIRTGGSRISDQNNYGELAATAAAAVVDTISSGELLARQRAAQTPTEQTAAIDWSSQITQKQIELLTAQGKQLEALNLQREQELASLTDAPAELRDLVTQLYGLREESIKATAAAKAAAEARAALIDATQDEIAAYKTTIDAFLAPLGDLDAAMRDINPPALALVDLWRQNKTEMQGLADALADLDGSRAQTAIERLSATMQQLTQFGDIRSGIASSIVDLKASKGDASSVALLKAQEASLTSQLATATDKGAIAQALTATVMRRIQIEGALEQKAINARFTAEQDALKEQIELAREARQIEIDALRERIAGVEKLREAAAGIADYLTSLRAGSLSPLGYTERLGESRSLFESTLRDAISGNGDALGNLRSNAQDYLGQAQQYFGGATSGYSSVFQSVTAALEQFGITAGGADAGGLKAQLEVLQSIDDSIEQQTAEQVDTTDRQIAAYEALDATFAGVEAGLKSSAAEQTAALREQIAELGKVVANQEAQITQAAAAYTAMIERLAEMNKKLDDIKADGALVAAAA